MKSSKPTLLEKAKSMSSINRSRKMITNDDIDLAVAWVNGDISETQAAMAYGMNNNNAAGRLARALRFACNIGKIKIQKLLIVFLLVGVVARGQRVLTDIDTTPQKHIIMPVATDTIPIIYLWCDTVIKAMRTGPAQWSFGYELIDGNQIWLLGRDGSKTPMFKHMQYLDRNKKPLPQSVVVWMVRKIN